MEDSSRGGREIQGALGRRFQIERSLEESRRGWSVKWSLGKASCIRGKTTSLLENVQVLQKRRVRSSSEEGGASFGGAKRKKATQGVGKNQDVGRKGRGTVWPVGKEGVQHRNKKESRIEVPNSWEK